MDWFFRISILIFVSFLCLMSFFETSVSTITIEKTFSSSLDNQYLTVAAIEAPVDFYVTRNSTGHITQFDGVSWMVFEWLSAAHINTTFNTISLNPATSPLDVSGVNPGIMDLVKKGEYSIVTNSVPTLSRSAIVDYTHPTRYLSVSYLIPASDQTVNIFTATKPFQTCVWISLFVTIIIVLVSALSMEAIGGTSKRHLKLEITFYVIGVILHQAFAYRFSKKLAIRMVLATWSLSALLLINYYNSLCISFMTISIKTPLIQSIRELHNRPEIGFVTDKNRNTDASILAAEFGWLQELGDRLRADPEARCNKSSQCVDFVKKGHSVYAGIRDGSLLKSLKDDFDATEKCNMEFGKENYLELQLAWATQKNSPLLDPLNKSFMRLAEAGLLQKWFNERLPKVEKCLPSTKMKGQQNMEEREPLPLIGFNGAFIIITAGTLIASIVFFIEIIIIKKIYLFKN